MQKTIYIVIAISALFAQKLNAEPRGVRVTGFSLGLLGSIATHELGHVVGGLFRGGEFNSVVINDQESGVGLGVKLRLPSKTEEENNLDLLIIRASGSLGQIVPVLILPHAANATKSPYLKETFKNWTWIGIFDFPMYVAKDIIMDSIDGYESGKAQGDWIDFSKSSGISLYTLFGASVIWSALLLRYYRVYEENFEFRPQPVKVPIFSLAYSI